MAATRVLVVAEETLARAGLAALLRERAELDIVGQVAALTAAEIDRYDPHVIVFDLGWDADAAVGVLADIVEAGVPVLALAPVDEAASMAWRAGARGILLRDAAPEAVETAIAGLMAGMAIIDLALAESYPLFENPHRGEPVEPLTPRELEVLQLVAEGLSRGTLWQRY